MRPNLASPEGGFRSADWPELARLGRELGAATVGAAEQAAFAARAGSASGAGGGGEPAAAGKTVTLPFDPSPPADELRALAADGRWPDGRSPTETERQWATCTASALAEGALPEGTPAEVQVFRLGHGWLVMLPGEVFVEIGWKVRDAVAVAAGVSPADVVVAAYANGGVGYVPTAAAIPEGGYEVTAYRHGGRPYGYARRPRTCWRAPRPRWPRGWPEGREGARAGRGRRAVGEVQRGGPGRFPPGVGPTPKEATMVAGRCGVTRRGLMGIGVGAVGAVAAACAPGGARWTGFCPPQEPWGW